MTITKGYIQSSGKLSLHACIKGTPTEGKESIMRILIFLASLKMAYTRKN